MATLTENIETLKSTINAEKSIIEDYDGPVPEGTNISTYEEKVRNIIKGRRHIGEIFYSTVPITDAGVHILDGSLLLDGGIYDSFITYIASLKDSYPNLFCTEEEWQSSVSTYGVCGKYVLTEGTSLRLPKITGFIEGISSTTDLGNIKEAGIPNIKCSIQKNIYTSTLGALLNAHVSELTIEGCIKTESTTSNIFTIGSQSSELIKKIEIDASMSNPVFGKSDTVQPQAIQLLVYVQVANSIPSDVELDIDNITTEVANKADKTEVANKAMPSDKYVDVSFSHGTYYVAPSDGYLTIYGYGSASPISIVLKDSNDSIVLLVNSAFGGVESDKSMGVTMPMRKGQISYMYYYNGTIDNCRFVYAEGNKP